ncbi:hypothetical protein HMI51_03360 [Corallococcus coralloides]|nr:hypothetical protein [Corallococcus coralloides]
MPRTQIATCGRRRGTVSEGVCGQGNLRRLNDALHEETGAPIFILVPTGTWTDLAPVVDMDLRFRTSSSPAFVVLELESCPAASASDVEAEVPDVTEDIAATVQAALGTPWTLAHLLAGRAPVAPRPST